MKLKQYMTYIYNIKQPILTINLENVNYDIYLKLTQDNKQITILHPKMIVG